jgi:hypothetical protein
MEAANQKHRVLSNIMCSIIHHFSTQPRILKSIGRMNDVFHQFYIYPNKLSEVPIKPESELTLDIKFVQKFGLPGWW